MHKIWTEHYPDIVPKKIYPDTYNNIIELFDDCLSRYRNLPLTTCMGVSHTYAEVNKIAIAISAWLQSINLPPKSVIALMMPNVPQYLPIMIAILRAGYICTPVNPLYTGRELKHQLTDSGAKAIFLIDNFAQALEQVVDETHIKHIVIAKMGDLMGVKGILVNMVIRNVKKLVPKYKLGNPNHNVYKFNDIVSIGKKKKFNPPLAADINDAAIYQYTGRGYNWIIQRCDIKSSQLDCCGNIFRSMVSPRHQKN